MKYFVRHSLKFTLDFLLLALPLTIAQSEDRPRGIPPMDQFRNAHMYVLDDLNVKDAKGKLMELDDPRAPDLLNKGWNLAGAYAAQYLEYSPAPSKRELDQIFLGFSSGKPGNESEYSFQGSAIRIGPSVYVVQASYGVDFLTSTFMIVARNHEGHFQKLWDIKALAAQHYAQRDEIGRWLWLVGRAYYNGPLAVRKVLPLAPAANGHMRFLVDAYQGADGGTTLNQLSVWEWDGKDAQPLLVELYQNTWDSEGFHFDGRTLRISTKEELESLFACGMCTEPRGVWTVRITPEGVQDLGHRFLKPEFQWADELLSKLDKGKNTTDLANARVLESLKARISAIRGEDVQLGVTPPDAQDFSWGMMSQCRVLRRGQRGAFVLTMDEAELHFTYELNNGHPYFTDVKIK